MGAAWVYRQRVTERVLSIEVFLVPQVRGAHENGGCSVALFGERLGSRDQCTRVGVEEPGQCVLRGGVHLSLLYVDIGVVVRRGLVTLVGADGFPVGPGLVRIRCRAAAIWGIRSPVLGGLIRIRCRATVAAIWGIRSPVLGGLIRIRCRAAPVRVSRVDVLLGLISLAGVVVARRLRLVRSLVLPTPGRFARSPAAASARTLVTLRVGTARTARTARFPVGLGGVGRGGDPTAIRGHASVACLG